MRVPEASERKLAIKNVEAINESTWTFPHSKNDLSLVNQLARECTHFHLEDLRTGLI